MSQETAARDAQNSVDTLRQEADRKPATTTP
jgi:hypothetical protein